MRNPLFKRIPREFRNNFGKYLGMAILLISIICVGSAFQVVLNGAVEYLDNIKEENLLEDGYFEVSAEPSSEQIESLEKKGVKISENFYASDNDFRYGEQDSAKVLLFDERTETDIPVVFEGRLPERKNEIALDHVFARGKDIEIGEEITLLNRPYRVVGTVSLPDYSSLFMNNTDLVMNTAHFCVAVVNHDEFETFEAKNLTYRYSYRCDDRNLTKAQKVTLSEEMMKELVLSGADMHSFLRADQNQSITFLETDIGSDGPFMTVFVYILIVLVAFVFAIMTNSTIENESVIIGTLRASGYRKGEIIWHYLQPTVIVAVLGSVIGNVLGYTVMIKPFLKLYYTTYSIGPIPIRFDVVSFVLTNVIPVALMILINVWMMVGKMSLSPLKFLRKELKKGKTKRAVKLPDVKFISRFRMRVLLQNKGSYVMLFIGIFLASFLLMFGIGLDPLMNHYTDSINESLPYEYQYILKAPAEAEDAEQVLVYEMDTWFELGKKDMGIICYGIEEDSRYFAQAMPEEGVTVSSALANKLGLCCGDELLLEDKSRDKEYRFRVEKIFEYTASMSVFLHRQELAQLLEKDEDYYNCLLSDKALDIDEMYIAKQITRKDMLGAAEQMMDSFSSVIGAINVFSVLVYMVLMYILIKVVIDKNALSVSYMKVFGYRKKEIRKLYLTPTAIVVVVSLLVCIPLEIQLFKLTLVWLSAMIEGYMEFYLPNTVYAEIVLVGLLAYFVINAFHVHQINKIPMTDALKTRE